MDWALLLVGSIIFLSVKQTTKRTHLLVNGGRNPVYRYSIACVHVHVVGCNFSHVPPTPEKKLGLAPRRSGKQRGGISKTAPPFASPLWRNIYATCNKSAHTPNIFCSQHSNRHSECLTDTTFFFFLLVFLLTDSC